jgi:threonine dehydrogenase-like Zn-dependent dehydrogenase
MKALQITEPGSFRIVDVDIPQPGEGEVLVEIEIVATCPRWDIHMMSGKDMFDPARSPSYPLPPGFPGHEAAGRVVAVGDHVSGLKVGDRVAALEHLPGNGAYAQYLNYPEHTLLKLPDNIPFKQAASIELLKCVIIGLQQFDTLQGKSIVIAGLGPAGILAMQAARIWGASRVVGVDINEERINYVRKLGFGEVKHANELNDERFDLGYDCVGFAESVQNIFAHVNHHLVIFGVLKGEVKFGPHLWGRGIRLESFGGRPVTDKDRELILDALAKGLDMECIQTHNIPFTRYDEAVERLKSQEAIKVHFYPGKDFA